MLFSIAVTQGVIFKCDYDSTSWSVVPDLYTCKVNEILTNSELSLEDAIGEHFEGKSNKDVEYLFVYNMKELTRMPTNMDKIFPILKGIEWHTSELTTLTAEDLKPFPDLRVFASYSNPLVSLDGDLFKYTPKLVWILFYNSSIESVGAGFIKDLKDLTFINFQMNPCTNAYATTYEKIREFALQLPIACSSKTKLTMSMTEVVEYTKILDGRVSELSRINTLYEKKLWTLTSDLKAVKEKATELKKAKRLQDEKIEDLEATIKDITTSPVLSKLITEIYNAFVTLFGF